MSRYSLIFLLILFVQDLLGQTISLPDTNFRNKLQANYPQVMQGNELIISQAAATKGTLDLRNSHITDATGIEYFTGIATLDVRNNELTTIPSLALLPNLINFYASYNKLTSVPDLTKLTLLRDFQVMNNLLTKLPDLSAAKGLWYLYCTNNTIGELPPLAQFPELLNLVVGNNPLKGSIDVSANSKLQELHVHLTGIDTVIGLDKLKKLSVLYGWSSSIKDFSGLDSNTTLTKCVIFNTPIEKLPFLSNKPNLTTLNVYECQLTFEDILSVLNQSPPKTFEYAPQRMLHINDASVRAGSIYSMAYPINTPSADNIYVFIKNGKLLDSTTSSTHTFNPLTIGDSGNYVLKVYNTSVPGLVLTSNSVRLNILPCIEVKLSSVNILSKECDKGYGIDFSAIQLSGGNAPFSYILENGVNKTEILNTNADSIPAGNYIITVVDAKKCTATDHFLLEKIEKCDPVITPNGDGIADNYFIEKSGRARIYDIKRKLIKTLDAPVVWDGTDQNGNVLDAGYYVISVDGEKPVYISIIR